MRYLLALLFCFLASFSYAQDTTIAPFDTIPLRTAIDKGLVEIEMVGASDPTIVDIVDQSGSFYGKCIVLAIQGKEEGRYMFKMDCGSLLVPDDTAVQTMLVTHDVYLPMENKVVYATRIYAMCSEMHDAAPSAGTTFKLGGMADEQMMKLAKYIERNNLQTLAGQHAVWAYTDKATFSDLKDYGSDSTMLAGTKNILAQSGLTTQLNPAEPKKEEKPSDEIALNKYIVYGGAGLIGILLFSNIIQIARSSRRRRDDMA